MVPAAVSRRSMVIAGFSTVVEWYDFTLYLYFATVLSRVFLGGGEGSLITTLAVNNFINAYGADADGLAEEVAEKTKAPRWPAATYKEGFEATVIGIKANEATIKGATIPLPKDLFQI